MMSRALIWNVALVAALIAYPGQPDAVEYRLPPVAPLSLPIRSHA
jgi:hypothetical protein